MYDYNFALDLDGQNLSALQRKKKKLNELLDKYGESREAIDQHSTPEDWMEYQFAQGDQYINEILEERRMKRAQNAFPQTPFPSLAQGNPNYTTTTNLPETEEETRQKLENNQPHSNTKSLKREASALHKALQSNSETNHQTTEQNKEESDDTNFIRLMGKNLIETEKMNNFIYLDKYGHITAGIGSMLDDEKIFKNMKWEINGRKATQKEIDKAYKIFTSLQQEKDSDGKPKYRNYKADYFKKFSELRLSEETMIETMREHLTNDLQRVRRMNINFDELPQPMKLIIMDFYYNLGSFFNQKNLPQALKARNKQAFKSAMIRGMPDRDEWTLKLFNQIPDSFWKQ